MNDFVQLIAQGTGKPQQQPGIPWPLLAIMFAMFAFMFLTSRSQKKREKRKRAEMYDRMAKNDRVLTSGGILGTVISVKENEVVVKVDESTNTKMTFLKTAIQRIVSEESASTTDRR